MVCVSRLVRFDEVPGFVASFGACVGGLDCWASPAGLYVSWASRGFFRSSSPTLRVGVWVLRRTGTYFATGPVGIRI